jgi:transcriptional regulator with XRE-family HTH domain
MDHLSNTGADELASRVGHQVSTLRRAQRMTAAELAERSELSRTIVSKIERGDGNPSIGTLWRISRALRVSLGDLLGEPDALRTRVIRAGDGETISDPSGLFGQLLHRDARERRTEVYALALPADARRESAAHLDGVEELIVMTSGTANVGPTDPSGSGVGPETLGPGDAMWFAADAPHHYENTGAAQCSFLCWMLYPPAAG